jgi:hypothetical protein
MSPFSLFMILRASLWLADLTRFLRDFVVPEASVEMGDGTPGDKFAIHECNRQKLQHMDVSRHRT